MTAVLFDLVPPARGDNRSSSAAETHTPVTPTTALTTKVMASKRRWSGARTGSLVASLITFLQMSHLITGIGVPAENAFG